MKFTLSWLKDYLKTDCKLDEIIASLTDIGLEVESVNDPAEELAGEICISVDQAIEESKERSIPLSRELTLYLIHGWLHLVGFDDKEEEDRRIMRREEEKALSHVSELDLWPDFLLDSTHV